ncbi:hypothetical protein [Streptomyces sp. cmx-18-6]|uniref:hypothetical protein n=1 Tax=Streptomyces sp. cmx-18-6 TaxID=2790930 RepID=UPI0039801FCD
MGRDKGWKPRWKAGDIVTPTGENDHPEDPVGEVLEESRDSGVLVLFPRAGHEFHHPDELAPAAPADLSAQHGAKEPGDDGADTEPSSGDSRRTRSARAHARRRAARRGRR